MVISLYTLYPFFLPSTILTSIMNSEIVQDSFSVQAILDRSHFKNMINSTFHYLQNYIKI